METVHVKNKRTDKVKVPFNVKFINRYKETIMFTPMPSSVHKSTACYHALLVAANW